MMIWPQHVMPINTINKLTFCLKAIAGLSSQPDSARHMGLIKVIASEILIEVATEIEAIKHNAMKAAGM